jgi:hypothetical protein
MNEAVMKIATEYYAASFPKVNRKGLEIIS